MKEQTKFRLLWVFVFLLGLALFSVPESEAWLASHAFEVNSHVLNLIRGVGEAAIIAAIIAVLVDQAAKRRLLKEFAANVSAHIIGRQLPPELRTHIEPFLETDFIRTSWDITYTITEWQGQPDYEKLITHSVHEIENRASNNKEYNCYYEVETSLFPDVGEAKILRASGTNLRESKVEFEYPKDPALAPRTDKETGHIIFEKKVTIPAHEGPADQSAPIGPQFRFSVESEECFRDGSIVPFFTRFAVLATTLTVHYPVELMDVFVDFALGDIQDDVKRQELATGREWRLKKPMLPGQGFSVRFVKKRQSKKASGASSFTAQVPAIPEPVVDDRGTEDEASRVDVTK
jgi:hypothetical protein